MTILNQNINQYIEYTYLNVNLSKSEINRLCQESIRYSFYGVVIPPHVVKEAVKLLKDRDIKVISVCSFPFGAETTAKKIDETVRLSDDGVNEIDLVANLEQLKNYNYSYIADEIESIRSKLPKDISLKVIIEAGILSDNQIIDSVKAVIDGKAEFVKTSTGTTKNATLEQFKLMAKTAERKIKLKAAGGIRSFYDCQSFIEAGADRIGTSSAIAIMNEIMSNE